MPIMTSATDAVRLNEVHCQTGIPLVLRPISAPDDQLADHDLVLVGRVDQRAVDLEVRQGRCGRGSRICVVSQVKLTRVICSGYSERHAIRDINLKNCSRLVGVPSAASNACFALPETGPSPALKGHTVRRRRSTSAAGDRTAICLRQQIPC